MSTTPSKFEVEQIVKVIKNIGVSGWVKDMDKSIGKEGRVVEVLFPSDRQMWFARVRVDDVGCYWYPQDGLEFVEFPETYAYFTVPETQGKFDTAEPDHILTDKDKVNFGTDAFDVLMPCEAHSGKAVKDVVCKSAQKWVCRETIHKLRSARNRGDFEHYEYFTPNGTFPIGTEVEDAGNWMPADLDGKPVPTYAPGDARPMYRRPLKPATEAFTRWVPYGPGDIRPEGLQYRRKGSAELWKISKVAGKPVEQADTDNWEYRVPV
jgi:hypothetical protein